MISRKDAHELEKVPLEQLPLILAYLEISGVARLPPPFNDNYLVIKRMLEHGESVFDARRWVTANGFGQPRQAVPLRLVDGPIDLF